MVNMKTSMEFWEDELEGLAESTRTMYRRNFNKFIESRGLTAEELFHMHRKAQANEDPRERRTVERMVRDYMKAMQEEGKAPGTARHVAKAVRSFFDANGLTFNLRRQEKPPTVYHGSRVITPEKIRKFYDSVGAEFRRRNRALILFAKDSGLRASDISKVNVEDYLMAEEVLNEAGERFKVFRPLQTQKNGQYAYIHIGPEAIKAIDDYLGERREGPLFLNRDGERLIRKSITNQILRLSSFLGKAGFKISAQSFRKFHRTQLEAKMNEGWIKRLQGKAASEYSHPEQNGNLTEAYLGAYDVLRIFDSEALAREENQKTMRDLKTRLAEVETGMVQILDMVKGEGPSIFDVGTGRRTRSQASLKTGIREIIDRLGFEGKVYLVSNDCERWRLVGEREYKELMKKIEARRSPRPKTGGD